MSENGKALVLGAIMKRQGMPFRARNIVEMTNLDRRNVAYHLNKLCETAQLERDGVIYSVVDNEKLINTLVESSDNNNSLKKASKTILLEKAAANLNETMDLALTARAMKLTDSMEFKSAILREIDESIKSLKNAKRWMTTATRTPKSARSVYKKNPLFLEQLWLYMTEGFNLDVTISKQELEDEINEFIEGFE